MTVKAHPDILIIGAKLSFRKREGEGVAFWNAIERYHSTVHTMSDAGATKTLHIYEWNVRHHASNWARPFRIIETRFTVGNAQYGGWLIPYSVIDSKNVEFTYALREIVEDGNVYIGITQ